MPINDKEIYAGEGVMSEQQPDDCRKAFNEAYPDYEDLNNPTADTPTDAKYAWLLFHEGWMARDSVRESVSHEQIWIVQGTTGEYSDRTEWIICAMYEESAAKELAATLAALGREASKLGDEGDYDWENKPAGKQLLAADPEARIDYTGIDYTAYCVKIKQIEGGN